MEYGNMRMPELKSLARDRGLTHQARETPYGARNCLLRIPDIPIWCLCRVALNPGYPYSVLYFTAKNNHLQFDWLIFDNSKQSIL